jgi:hypothetical protein
MLILLAATKIGNGWGNYFKEVHRKGRKCFLQN